MSVSRSFETLFNHPVLRKFIQCYDREKKCVGFERIIKEADVSEILSFMLQFHHELPVSYAIDLDYVKLTDNIMHAVIKLIEFNSPDLRKISLNNCKLTRVHLQLIKQALEKNDYITLVEHGEIYKKTFGKSINRLSE